MAGGREGGGFSCVVTGENGGCTDETGRGEIILVRLRGEVDRRDDEVAPAAPTPVGGVVGTRGSNRALRIDEPALPVSPQRRRR